MALCVASTVSASFFQCLLTQEPQLNDLKYLVRALALHLSARFQLLYCTLPRGRYYSIYIENTSSPQIASHVLSLVRSHRFLVGG